MNFPDKKYKIIYADPPWRYEFTKSYSRDAGKKYDDMYWKDIAKLPIRSIAEEDSILFMWATFPKLEEALEVMKSWGFTYRTTGFVWVKKYLSGKHWIGMGFYTRSNAEPCLIGVKGKGCPQKDKSIRQIIETTIPRANQFDSKTYVHSKKPDIVRQKIIQLCGDLSRIELFARTKVHGWDTWGNDEKLENQPLEAFMQPQGLQPS